MTPTQRTLKRFREAGYHCEVVERWCQFSKRRKDLFGFIDILAIKEGRIVGIQATSGGNTSARIKKINEEPNAKKFLDAGGVIIVIGWRPLVARKKDGTKARRPRWACKVKRVRSIPPA